MIKIYKRPRLRDPYMVAGWPGMGEVAIKAVGYLKEKLKLERFALFETPGLFPPTEVEIRNNIIELPKAPQGIFYYWTNTTGGRDLVLFTSDRQPPLERGLEYADQILDVAKEFKVSKIYTLAAIPVPIDHIQTPEVWGTVTHKELIRELNHYKVKIMASGQISGLNGLLLGVAKKYDLHGICLLGEIPLYTIQIENPKASLALLKVLTSMLDIKVDMLKLEEQAKNIEEEIKGLIDSMKLSPSAEPMSDEEIERIKKGLAAYTKLPKSAKETIEKMFEESRRDISKAHELKAELDKWNVYKEYEDRFLDLFKKEQ